MVRKLMWMAFVACGAMVFLLMQAEAAEREVQPPDFTKGEGPDVSEVPRGWFLHFYGTHGWIYGSTNAERDHARQILVTNVPRFSEISGSLFPGDVILGVNGKLFDRHAVFQFREFSIPATRAGESLSIIMWRPGWDEPQTVLVEPRDGRPDFTSADPTILTDEDIAVAQNLGATGLKGWMFGSEQVGHQTDIRHLKRAHQIYITHVDEGSPADGIFQVGDVIVGVDNEPFENHARRFLGEALTQAETEEGGGKLHLLRWREGETEPVTLQLDVLGTYSDTVPWNCPKSERIVENALAYLADREGITGNGLAIPALVQSLGLLATGDARFLPSVREHAELIVQQVAEAGEALPDSGMQSWSWGYINLFLTEYYLATGDRQVLPTIETYSHAIAYGQSMGGTWGHSMTARDAVTGEPRPVGGYGTLNQSSTLCWITLILARRSGVTSPLIESAIQKKHQFLNNFIDVGSVTYGENLPGGLIYDENGRTAAAAVGYALLGDGKGTDFFSRMSVASHSIREHGHTGHFWSDLWGGLGARRAGQEALTAFLREDLWRLDLERRWDGGFDFQPVGGVYSNWGTTGQRLLLFSIPRQQLAIAGREVLTTVLTPEEVADVIEAGRLPAGMVRWPDKFKGLSTQALLRKLGHWSPVAREQAAIALAANEDAAPPLDALREMLQAENRYARYGACKALRHLGSRAQPVVDDLIALLDAEDRVLQINAILALGQSDDPRAVDALFDMAARQLDHDPYDVVHRRTADALFGRGNLLNRAHAVEDRDRKLDATRALLTSKQGSTRSTIADHVLRELTLEEFKALWPEIQHARATYAIGYNTAIQMETLRRLQAFRVREGIDDAVAYLTGMWGHGSQRRVPEVLDILRGYGAHVRVAIPELEEAAHYFEHEETNFPRHLSLGKAEAVRAFIEELEAMEDPGEGAEPLISIAAGWR